MRRLIAVIAFLSVSVLMIGCESEPPPPDPATLPKSAAEENLPANPDAGAYAPADPEVQNQIANDGP